MKIIKTVIDDVKLLEPRVFGDERGFFMETYRDGWFRENVADVSFLQDNHSKSSYGTLRGMHFQTQKTQGKLVRVVEGEVFDVAVDLRKSSSTFGKWVGEYLSSSNRRQLWVPAGFAHGFIVTSDTAEFVYKCTDYYHPDSEESLKWNDVFVDILWPIDDSEIKLSDKDFNGKDWIDLPFFD